MQILVVTSTYPSPIHPRQGAFNRIMVDALRRNHRVAVIAPVPWTQLCWQDIGNDLFERKKEFQLVENDTQHPVFYYTPKIFRNQYHHFYWMSMRRCLSRLPNDFRPDVVLGYWLHPDGDAAIRSARHFGIPAVVMSGGTDLRILTQNRRRRKAIMRVMDEADRVVVVSRELRRQAESLGTSTDKIDVVNRGVDLDCFTPGDRIKARHETGLSADNVVLAWVGRLEAVKNPRMLLRAAERLTQHWRSNLRILIIGDGSMRVSLEQECRQRGLCEWIRFEGNLSQADLAVRYRAANATLLTSHSEGIPNVLLESIACGTPFVATNVGGVSEIATMGIDFLVENDDADELAQATIELVSRDESPRRRDFVPTDPAEMVNRLEDVFLRTLDNRCVLRRANGNISVNAQARNHRARRAS